MSKAPHINILSSFTKLTSYILKSKIVSLASIIVLAASALSFRFSNISVRAATVNFAATIPSSGTGPFDADDLAGHDSSATNSIIRSNDDLIFKYVISPADDANTNVVINHTLTNAIWQETFPFCTNTDQISSDRFTLKCVLGYVNSTLNLSPKAWTHANYNQNGAQVTSNLTCNFR